MKKMKKAIEMAYKEIAANTSFMEEIILHATEANFGGDRHYLEIFPDGSFRVAVSPGNRYDSPGILLDIPRLGEDEYDTRLGEHYFDDAVESLQEAIQREMET